MSKEKEALTIPNYQVLPLVKFLEAENLSGKVSRSRTKFIQLIADRIKELEEERLKICEKFSEKKKVKGEEVIVYIGKDGKDTTVAEGSNFKIKDIEGFNKEYVAIMSENFIFDILPSTTDLIKDIKNVVLNTSTQFKGPDAAVYNQLCEIFE